MPRRFQPVPVSCEGCATLFMTRAPDQRFCSRSCAARQPRPNRRRSPAQPKTCSCGCVFTPSQPRVKYCSRLCGQTFGGTVRSKTCGYCGSIYETRTAVQMYCTTRCQQAARKARTFRVCEECRVSYNSIDSRSRYCSRSCARARGRRLRGPNSSSWRGGRTTHSSGYAMVRAPDHPRAKPAYPYVLEHILVMEALLGRHLEPHERVHHRNGRRRDNRPENLELWKMKDPPGVRSSDYHCAGCVCER